MFECPVCKEVLEFNDAVFDILTEQKICSVCYDEKYPRIESIETDCTNLEETLKFLGISKLSKELIEKIQESKMPILYNKNDLYLKEIAEKVGLVKHTIYVYGLKNRPEYDVKLTYKIYEILKIKKILNENLTINTPLGEIKVEFSDYYFKDFLDTLGISLRLREQCLSFVINFIKEITN